MIGNLVSAAAGRTLAQSFGGAAAGPAGTAIGLALPFVAKRLGPVGMIGMAVGAWAIGRLMKDRAEKAALPANRKPIVTPPPIAMVVGD